MKKLFATTMSLLFFASSHTPLYSDDTPDAMASWANWEKKLDRAFDGVSPRKTPGRTMGLLVPAETRPDLYPLMALGAATLYNQKPTTIVILFPQTGLTGKAALMTTDLDVLETSFGLFPTDKFLAQEFGLFGSGSSVQNDLFYPTVPPLLETQLAFLKYVYRQKMQDIKVLPIAVRLSDPASDAKDIGSAMAEKIKDLGLENDVIFIFAADLTETTEEQKLIQTDSRLLMNLRSIDVDGLLDIQTKTQEERGAVFPHMDVLDLGVMVMKWLGGDHGEVVAYAHSGQLVLTKDKKTFLSFGTAAFCSGPPYPVALPHIDREKLLNIFDELLRSDLIQLARQSCASILDPTAAKPPSLINPESKRKWPVYVTLYDPAGNVAGQAGSYVAIGPLEESIRRYSYDAVSKARPGLSKENFSKYIVDVSIPHGFTDLNRPEELVPQLNGLIVQYRHKKVGFHPDAWRLYPDAHQILGAMCVQVGLRPWDYATNKASIEAFRVLSFNEKEPFQDLGAQTRRRKKKKDPNEEEGGDAGGGGGGGGGGAFPF